MKSRLYAGIIFDKIRNVRPAILATTVVVLASPATPSFAHDTGHDDDFFGHVYDHLEHQRFHPQFNEEHNAAHWEGFASPEEHEDWHRAYGATHREFHQDHSAPWHDHHSYGAYGYQPYIWYQPYGYTGWYRGY